MGILLDDGFTTKGIRKSDYVGFGSKKTVKEVKNYNTSQDNSLKKLGTTAAAVGALGSGAILLYMGVKGIDYPKAIHKIYQGRVSDIAQIVVKFKDETLEVFEQHYKKLTPYVKNYVQLGMFNSEKAEKGINSATETNGVLKTLDEALGQVRDIRHRKDRVHSEADNFRSAIYEINDPAYKAVSQLRNGRGFDVLDKSVMPKSQNAKYQAIIDEYESKLGKMKRNTDKTLFTIQNQITDEYLHNASDKMVQAILKVRRNHINSEEKLMETSFAKVAELLNLQGDFLPLFKKGLTLKDIKQLPSENLKPKTLSARAKNLIPEPFVQKVLEKTDFTDISRKELQDIYNSIPIDFDIRQLNLVTDRIRLQQAVLNAGGNNTSEYRTIAAKLEFLSASLKDFGTEQLLQKCDKDFSGLNKEQLKAKMYYVNKEARKLGMAYVGEIEDFLTYKTVNPTFQTALKTVKSNPEYYFM